MIFMLPITGQNGLASAPISGGKKVKSQFLGPYFEAASYSGGCAELADLIAGRPVIRAGLFKVSLCKHTLFKVATPALGPRDKVSITRCDF